MIKHLSIRKLKLDSSIILYMLLNRLIIDAFGIWSSSMSKVNFISSSTIMNFYDYS